MDAIMIQWAYYLPHKLQVTCSNRFDPNPKEKPLLKGATATLTGDLYADIENGTYRPIASFKPILRPMDDFDKGITHDGQMFVPAHLIFEAAMGGIWNDGFNQLKKSGLRYIMSDSTGQLIYWFGERFFMARAIAPDGENDWSPPFDQVRLFNLLFSWHFDVYGLIEKGLAMDYNTLSDHGV